jgi:hypothetical protein
MHRYLEPARQAVQHELFPIHIPAGRMQETTQENAAALPIDRMRFSHPTNLLAHLASMCQLVGSVAGSRAHCQVLVILVFVKLLSSVSDIHI